MTYRSYLGAAALIVFALVAIFIISSALDVWVGRSAPADRSALPALATTL